MFGNYVGFSDHWGIHVVLWGFLFAMTMFVVLTAASIKNDKQNND